jgi:sulfate adenylyltransferase
MRSGFLRVGRSVQQFAAAQKFGGASARSFATRHAPAFGRSGKLHPLLVPENKKAELKSEAIQLPEIVLSDRQLNDIELLLNGGLTPLGGFMTQKEYTSVVENWRLPDGLLWPVPVCLEVNEQQLKGLGDSNSVALKDKEGNIIAVLDISDIYQPNKEKEAREVWGGDPEHPAVHYLFRHAGTHNIGGKLRGLQLPPHYDHRDLRRTPEEVRAYFDQHGWNKVVAFQTRNPLHRAHFELTLRAMDATKSKLLLHPVVGMTKPGDIDHHTRVKCYRRIMNRYPKNSALLSALPLAMRMGGPREATWHAIIRQNYGATHFILGRDHAGPGSNSKGVDFYGPYEARDAALARQKELQIQLVPFEMMVYVPSEMKYYAVNEVPKDVKQMKLSGTEVRRRLQTGEEIPEWFSFPEVVEILRWAHPPRAKQGYCVFFTGLSGSGKTTIANALMERLMEIDKRSVCMLDGDHVRQMLSSELTFSKEHRNLNIKRIGYVASEVVKPGGVAIAAPIAPYAESRAFARAAVEKFGAFVEVFVSTSIDECKRRDRKGLYAKAAKGLLKGMTGVDDPYETPLKAEIVIDAEKVAVVKAVDMIVHFLEDHGYLKIDDTYKEAAYKPEQQE